MSSPAPPARLPNAPLAEAVFEIHWALAGDPEQPVYQLDPGILPLVRRFTDGAKLLGFGTSQDLAMIHELAGPGILRRFYKAQGQSFPVMQVGPGAYAYNKSADYFWPEFKSEGLAGYDLLVQSYPKIEEYPLSIEHVELRYIDVFDESLVETADFIEFIGKAFNWPVGLPQFVLNKRSNYSEIDGRIQLSALSKSMDNTRLSFDLAKGMKDSSPVFRLEIKMVQKFSEPAKASKNLAKKIDAWLEEAHSVTSPFFKALVQPEIMKKFGG